MSHSKDSYEAVLETVIADFTGNNAVEMETTATFDRNADEFVIRTPTTLAQKYWITNSAVHAKWAVVFAQMIIADENHGIHGFLVRIRNEVTSQFARIFLKWRVHSIKALFQETCPSMAKAVQLLEKLHRGPLSDGHPCTQ